MAGMVIYATLPGMKQVPIWIPTTSTVADMCRAIFEKTGVTLFNGFGYLGKNTAGDVAQGYYVASPAKIDTQGDLAPVQKYTGAVTTDKDLFAPQATTPSTVIDVTMVTAATAISTLGITTGMEVIFFSTGDTTQLTAEGKVQKSTFSQQKANA